MGILDSLFSKKEKSKNELHPNFTAKLDKDTLAELLKTSPEALDAFENAYESRVLNAEDDSDNFSGMNSRQASAKLRKKQNESVENFDDKVTADNLVRKIADELLSQTAIYSFDGNLAKAIEPKALPESTALVSADDIKQLPEALRPQLTGELMKADIGEPSYPILMFYFDKALRAKTQQEQKSWYNHFRQGLDILDLDDISYEIIGRNRNSMGHWFPQLVEACRGTAFFKIPATKIAKVPLTLLQLAHNEYSGLTHTTLRIVDDWTFKTFELETDKTYFIKTGTYSSKFDFRNAKVAGEKEVRELGEYLLYIHYQALQMASPLATPSIYGVSTTNEWVVREYIEDKENNPCIYKGMPLHTEYRVFVDCDTNTVLGISPYWEPKTMKERFLRESSATNPHDKHDYVIYTMHEEKLMQRYNENKDKVTTEVEKILPELNLSGQWSIDIMQNGDDFWLIDMALAENSAFYCDVVPAELRKPSAEEWIPNYPLLTIQS